MAIDDIIAAFSQLKQGVQEASTMSAIEEARQQVNQIKTDVANDAQQRQSIQQTANDLTLKLTGLGASGAQIQSAFSAIAPPAPATPGQAILQGQLTGDDFLTKAGRGTLKELYEAGIPAEERAHTRQRELTRIRADRAIEANLAKVDKESRSAVKKEIGTFRKTHAKALVGLRNMGKLRGMLDAGEGQAAVNFGRTMLLKAAGEDRLTEEDFERSNLNTDIFSGSARAFKNKFQNERLLLDEQEIIRLLNAVEERETEAIRDDADSLSTVAEFIPGATPEEVASHLQKSVGVYRDSKQGEEAAAAAGQPTPVHVQFPASRFMRKGR